MRMLGLAVVLSAAAAHVAPRELPTVVPNDNRASTGVLRDNVLTVRLEAKLGAWRPDLDVDSAATVQTFAEEGGTPRIPGPLLRTTRGTHVVVTVRNSLTLPLRVHGLRGEAFATDTFTVAPGETREVRFVAGAPGTYMYWGTTSDSRLGQRNGRDSQLTGAMIIDASEAPRDTAERLFVITLIDIYKSDTARNKAGEEIWDLAVNGRSWPHTERLEYPVGSPVRWRWLNGSDRFHPMHLHGFHFRVLGTGAANRYTQVPEAEQRSVVTQIIYAGQSFAMEWTPTRAGRWLMHCHMIPHITPYPERPDSAHIHDLRDVSRHPMSGMSGLVIGVTTRDTMPAATATLSGFAGARRLRLIAQLGRPGAGDVAHGFVLQRDEEPKPDSVEVPGSTLVLTRGQRAVITVVNRLPRPTTVHWHGMELESVYDGVAGWSQTSGSVAPLLAPGDSFTVAFTPPRAGTYMYHTHMDEGKQLTHGMYGPMIVLEPGQRYDPTTDLTFTVGGAVVNDTVGPALNGARSPAPRDLTVGRTYRMRLINLDFVEIAGVLLTAGSDTLKWRAVAKDGAELPAALVKEVPAFILFGVGEAYDFEFTPRAPGDLQLRFRIHGVSMVQPLRVR